MKRIYRGTRNFFIAMYSLIVVFTIVLCLSFFGIFRKTNPMTSKGEAYEKYYVLISDDTDSDFWVKLCEGASIYGAEHNICVRDLSSDFTTKLTKEQLMTIAIASKVDGIIVNADETSKMRELISEASKASIPVITTYNDCVNSNRISFVGIENYKIGKEYGKRILDTISNDRMLINRDRIKITVLMNSVLSSEQSLIYTTLQENLDAHEEDLPEIELSKAMINESTTFSAEEGIKDIFISPDSPDFVVCLSEIDTICAFQSVRDYNKVGDIHILGYYDSASILQGVQRGIIDTTIGIDASQMGQFCVKALLDYDKAGYTSQYFTVDVRVIDRKNVESFMEVDDEIEIQ